MTKLHEGQRCPNCNRGAVPLRQFTRAWYKWVCPMCGYEWFEFESRPLRDETVSTQGQWEIR